MPALREDFIPQKNHHLADFIRQSADPVLKAESLVLAKVSDPDPAPRNYKPEIDPVLNVIKTGWRPPLVRGESLKL